MRLPDDFPIDPELQAELDAIDATLSGEPVDPRYAEVAELTLLLAAERPVMRTEFAAELDARVEQRFRRVPGESDPGARVRLPVARKWSGLAWWQTGGGFVAALAATVAVVIAVGSGGSGGLHLARNGALTPASPTENSAPGVATSTSASTASSPGPVYRAAAPRGTKSGKFTGTFFGGGGTSGHGVKSASAASAKNAPPGSLQSLAPVHGASATGTGTPSSASGTGGGSASSGTGGSASSSGGSTSSSGGSASSSSSAPPAATTPALTPAVPTPAGPQQLAASAPNAAAGVQPVPNGRRQIQSAQLSLTAAASRVDDVAQEAFDVIGDNRGIVRHSSVTAGGPGGFATILVSVPSQNLAQTMTQLSELRYAHVSARTDQSQDVNDQYLVDVRRLGDAKALRTSLLKQLAAATTQTQIDSLDAQIHDNELTIQSDEKTLASLNKQISYSQINLTINAGVVPVVHHHHAAATGFTLHRALHDAGRVLVVAAGVSLITLAVLLPLAVVLGLLGWIATSLRRRSRQSALNAF